MEKYTTQPAHFKHTGPIFVLLVWSSLVMRFEDELKIWLYSCDWQMLHSFDL